MRNSFSLSVYFLLVLKSDVKNLDLEKKTKTASGKMKLIPLIILLTSLAVNAQHQKFRQDYFPPQFQTPNVGVFSSDSSLYLPPESHTTIPYFPMKNMNNLQFPYLPPTGTKAPSVFPTPFPFVISTTLVPSFDDDDDDEDHGRIRLSTGLPQMQQRANKTEKSPEPPKDKREMRAIPNMFQQPIQNRNDIKFPFKMPSPPAVTPSPPTSPTPASRRMIISGETQKADFGFDQLKGASSFQGPQFLPAGAGIYVSSTTEPAIPILRLSNEMDLDGSFSYEALGADQTHYVQHSRMENMGTDKQEQVVEGSYSYIGDNGQTYTVHYIADANGFRASGDHLPVAPPVPEIIQRAVQYNLAEEAKKPPHLRQWQDDGKENHIGESEIQQQYSLPPARNLFTGRTPEAFSYTFSQGSNTQNNLIAAASTQSPIKTVDYTTEQSKPKANNGPISPQITFLASQGAHVPSINPVQNAISRMFTTEKPLMPQLVNYEAGVKEAEQDPNRGLWRWQYGINANNLNQNPNQNLNKDTISRSFGEGDDVMINFSDMTPDQYTKMIRSQFEYNPENVDVQNGQYNQNLQTNENENKNTYFTNYQNQQVTQKQNQAAPENSYGMREVRNENNQPSPSTVSIAPQSENWYNQVPDYHAPQEQKSYNQPQEQKSYNQPQEQQNYNQPQEQKSYNQPQEQQIFNQDQERYQTQKQNSYNQLEQQKSYHQYQQQQNYNEESQIKSTMKPVIESRKLISNNAKILTHKDFVHPSQTVTQSYNFEDTFYEPRKIKALNADGSLKVSANTANDVLNNYEKSVTPDNFWPNTESEIKESTTQESYISSISNLKFTDFIVQESKSDFKPIVTTTSTEASQVETTENIIEDILENNIFLKNLFSPEKSDMFYPDKVEAYQPETTKETHHEKPKNTNSIKSEMKTENQESDDHKKFLHIKIEAEPKPDKIPKIIQYQTKPVNDIKMIKKKPMDIAEILNYVSMKNHFESSKMKPKSKPIINNFDQKNEIRFIPIQQERVENESNASEPKGKLRTLNQEQQEELRGMIKNYKVLQRNNNNMKYDNIPLKRELSPPPFKSPNLPPLGRAGPSMKSYLPPIFV